MYQLVTNGTRVSFDGDEGAPGRRAAMRVDDVAAAAAHDARDRGDVARHDRGIFAGDIGVDEFAAGFLDLAARAGRRATSRSRL